MNSTRQSLTSEIAEHLHAAIAQGSEVDPYYTPEMVAATPQQRQIAEMASRTIAEAAPTVAR